MKEILERLSAEWPVLLQLAIGALAITWLLAWFALPFFVWGIAHDIRTIAKRETRRDERRS